MMSVLASTEQGLMHKLGPLPVWAWAAMAGGGVLVYRVIHKNAGGTSTALGTANNTLTGAGSGSGTSTGTTGTGSTGSTGGTGSTASSIPSISPTDLAGGSVLDFVKGLGQNFNSFSFATGGSSVGVNNSAQNLLDAQNFQEQLITNAQNHQADLTSASQLAAIAANLNSSLNANQLMAYQAYLQHGGNPSFAAPTLQSPTVGANRPAVGGYNPPFVTTTPSYR